MEYALEVALIMPQISHLIIVLILVLMEYALEALSLISMMLCPRTS